MEKIIQFQITQEGLLYILTEDGRLYYGKVGGKLQRIKLPTKK